MLGKALGEWPRGMRIKIRFIVDAWGGSGIFPVERQREIAKDDFGATPIGLCRVLPPWQQEPEGLVTREEDEVQRGFTCGDK